MLKMCEVFGAPAKIPTSHRLFLFMNILNLSRRSLHELNTCSSFDKSRVLSFNTKDLLKQEYGSLMLYFWVGFYIFQNRIRNVFEKSWTLLIFVICNCIYSGT